MSEAGVLMVDESGLPESSKLLGYFPLIRDEELGCCVLLLSGENPARPSKEGASTPKLDAFAMVSKEGDVVGVLLGLGATEIHQPAELVEVA